MKTVNSYDKNGFFDGAIPCQESPLEQGVYLIPGNSTELELPPLSTIEEAKFVDGAWVAVKSRAETGRKKEEQDLIDKQNAEEDKAKFKHDRKLVKDKVQPILGLSNNEMDLLFGKD